MHDLSPLEPLLTPVINTVMAPPASGDWMARVRGARTLGQLSALHRSLAEQLLPVLIELTYDENSSIRCEAITGLGRLAWSFPDLGQAAAPALIKRLSDHYYCSERSSRPNRIYQQAAHVLEQSATPGALEALSGMQRGTRQ